jgi:hypothetical protein
VMRTALSVPRPRETENALESIEVRNIIGGLVSDKQLNKNQGYIMVAVEHSKYDQHLA